MKVVDVRHEVNCVFAADAHWRMCGVPGVAVVTAGPGVTNTITALQNAKMAESAVVLIAGATTTLLRGKGSLQDIDQIALLKPLVKYAASPKTVREVMEQLQKAFNVCLEGVPGPVFIELPVDIMYPMEAVLKTYMDGMPKGKSISARLISAYVSRHLNNLFQGVEDLVLPVRQPRKIVRPSRSHLKRVQDMLNKSSRPILLVGSQAMINHGELHDFVQAVRQLRIPTFFGGMARGLLGDASEFNFKHGRSQALKRCDMVILCGIFCDFRLQYGNIINNKAKVVSVNLSREKGTLNRTPSLFLLSDPCAFLVDLMNLDIRIRPECSAWLMDLQEADRAAEAKIHDKSRKEIPDYVNPLDICISANQFIDEHTILVMDGGDFVGTAAYTVKPRKVLSWLDPGAFGTLGVGAGFAMGAMMARKKAEVMIFYGDGALGFSIPEFDTFVRHKMGVICIVGNDAGWTQILRDQEKILALPTACNLTYADYHEVAQGFGGKGFLVRSKEGFLQAMKAAKQIAAGGCPVLINCLIARSDFREGSLSI
mmetsp:Transcript_8791/g.29356  ORF Transcript_8791/g.29356 Transcript_8791/m.29356 type:complete len:540 (+) Transcript_8791:344-1963(+)